MSGGFEFDPASVRAFAEVFAMASSQVETIKGEIGATTAKAADFGNAADWQEYGTRFEDCMAALAQDLGNLSKSLGEISAQLNQTTDLTLQADASGYDAITSAGANLDGEAT